MHRIIHYGCSLLIIMTAQLVLFNTASARPLTNTGPINDQAIISEDLTTSYDALRENFSAEGTITDTINMDQTLSNQFKGSTLLIEARINRAGGALSKVGSGMAIVSPDGEVILNGLLMDGGFVANPDVSDGLNYDFLVLVDKNTVDPNLEYLRISTVSRNTTATGDTPTYFQGTPSEESFAETSFTGTGYSLVFATEPGQTTPLGECIDGVENKQELLDSCVAELNTCTGETAPPSATVPPGDQLDLCSVQVTPEDAYDACIMMFESKDQALDQCRQDLEACNPDDDRDSVVDESDQCPNTPLGEPVNASGCAINDFCTSITERGKCERAEFKAIGDRPDIVDLRSSCNWDRKAEVCHVN